MDANHATSRYTRAEEIANSLTHGIGAVLAIAGLAVLTAFAAVYGDGWHIVSSAVFGGALILLYLASTLYHAIHHPRVKPILRILDHSAILVLIAGTYTPITLVSLRGPWGWSVFAVIWGWPWPASSWRRPGCGGSGRCSSACTWSWAGRWWPRSSSMLANVEPGGLWLLLAGGLAYTGGIGFYPRRRLPYNHAIWHLFVLAGSILHYFAVLFYIIPVMAD